MWNPVLWLSGHVTVAQLLKPRLSFLKSHSSSGHGLHGLAASAGRRPRSAKRPFSATTVWTSGRAAPSKDEDQGVLRGQGPCRELFPRTQRPSAARRGCGHQGQAGWNPRNRLPVCPGSCVTERVAPSVKWVNTRPRWAGLATPDNTPRAPHGAGEEHENGTRPHRA